MGRRATQLKAKGCLWCGVSWFDVRGARNDWKRVKRGTCFGREKSKISVSCRAHYAGSLHGFRCSPPNSFAWRTSYTSMEVNGHKGGTFSHEKQLIWYEFGPLSPKTTTCHSYEGRLHECPVWYPCLETWQNRHHLTALDAPERMDLLFILTSMCRPMSTKTLAEVKKGALPWQFDTFWRGVYTHCVVYTDIQTLFCD